MNRSSAFTSSTFVISCCFLVAVMEGSSYYNSNHGPFEDDERVARFAIEDCDALPVEDVGDKRDGAVMEIYGLPKGQPNPRLLQLEYDMSTRTYWVDVVDAVGKTVGMKMKLGFNRGVRVGAVWRGDLNQDGQPDFVVKSLSLGVGTVYVFSCHVAFVLSGTFGYNVTVVNTIWSGEDYFVDLNGDGVCEFIATDFVVAGDREKSRDGKYHNFWVYNLLEMRGMGVVLNNDIDRRFPRWVWYTYQPNHQQTTMITSEQKDRLWKPYAETLFLPMNSAIIKAIGPYPYEGYPMILTCDPADSDRDYRAPAACALPDDDPYVTARGADKGLVRVITDGKKQMKEYIVPHSQINAVVELHFGDIVVEDYDFVFTDEQVIEVWRSNSNAGIFSSCDVYELKYFGVSREIDTSKLPPLEAEMLGLAVKFHREMVQPTLHRQSVATK